MKNITHIRLYMLTYARGTLGIGCIRFKHGRIRWHTARQKHFFKHAKKFCAYWTYGLYDKHTLCTHALNTLEVRQMYGTHTLAFQRIFVILCVWKLFQYASHTFLSYAIVWQGLYLVLYSRPIKFLYTTSIDIDNNQQLIILGTKHSSLEKANDSYVNILINGGHKKIAICLIKLTYAYCFCVCGKCQVSSFAFCRLLRFVYSIINCWCKRSGLLRDIKPLQNERPSKFSL
jgi:hypothetical protein